MELNYGHLLEVGPSGSLNRYRFQNFAINARLGGSGQRRRNIGRGAVYFEAPKYVYRGSNTDEPFMFLPFHFGGALATLSGDNLDATLQFGNTTIARNFVVEALDNNYVARVQTVLWYGSSYGIERVLYEYFGSCSAGGWDETRLQVKLNSVLDAVQTNVPGRRLRRQHVGNLPFTANVRV